MEQISVEPKLSSGHHKGSKDIALPAFGSLSSPDSSPNAFQLGWKGLEAFQNQNLGFVFKFHELLDEFTALKNDMMAGLIQGKKQSGLGLIIVWTKNLTASQGDQ